MHLRLHVLPCSALLLLGLGAGCARPSQGSFERRLSSRAAVIGDAPDDSSLPDDIKSDAPLPPRYLDLLTQQSPIRDQGARGVCTIFATTALLEHVLVKAGASAPDLSEQLGQWSEKNEAADANHREASSLGDVMASYAAHGVTTEATWPYDPTVWQAPAHPECTGDEATEPLHCLTDGDPSAAALAAPRSQLQIGRYLRTSAIKDYLYQQKTAVAVGLEFIDSAWSYPPDTYTARRGAWERGEIAYPSAAELAAQPEAAREGHAVLIVGWDDTHTMPVVGDDGRPALDAGGEPLLETGFYVVKNSWGTDYWGADNPHGAGYGFLSERYVADFGHPYVVGLPTGAALPATGERYTGGVGIALPGGGEVTDTIDVPDAGPLTELDVDVQIDDPSAAALIVKLSHDDLSYVLWRNAVGVGIHGTWRVASGLDRTDRGGPWALSIANAAGGATGTLTSWAIVLQ